MAPWARSTRWCILEILIMSFPGKIACDEVTVPCLLPADAHPWDVFTLPDSDGRYFRTGNQ
jgi:hypothetical protein